VVTPGGSAEVYVHLRVAPGHYLHGPSARPPFTKASVELSPAADVFPNPVVHGALEGSAAEADRLSGVVEFRRSFTMAPDAAAGPREMACVLTYQVCNPEICWPRATMELRARFTVSSLTAKETP
jgi:hypothetical protein